MARFIHNPFSYICVDCGQVVEIRKDGSFLGTAIWVRCHNRACPQSMRWYRIDTEKLMVNGVIDEEIKE